MKKTIITLKLSKRLISAILIFTMLALFSGCSSHECVPGDWVVTKNASYLESGEKTRYCIECEEPVETTSFELTSFIENDAFIFSPNDFTYKLDACLQNIEGDYGAYIGVRDEDNVVASCIYRDSEHSGVCIITYSKGEDSFTYEASTTKTGADGLLIFFDASCNDEELALVLPPILRSLNPLLTKESAVQLSSSIIEKSESSGVVDGGILYRLIDVEGIFDSKWWLYIAVDD